MKATIRKTDTEMKIEKLSKEDVLMHDMEIQDGCMGCTDTVWSGAASLNTSGCYKITIYNTGWMFGSLF